MHTQKETLVILNCDKSTLSRYVKDGKINRVKRGRNTYYDEHEVSALVATIEMNKEKVGIEIKEKETIPIPDEVISELENVGGGATLDKVGFELLSEATVSLKELGLYDECDKQVLALYAINSQMYYRYLYASLEKDHIFTNQSGNSTVHPHFKVMQHHEKQMLSYMDRLGLNPLSRTKLDIKKKQTIDPMEALING